MRTIIGLAVLAVALGAGTTGYAQESMMQKLSYRPTRVPGEAWAGQSTPQTEYHQQAAPPTAPPSSQQAAHQPIPPAPMKREHGAEPVVAAAGCGGHDGCHRSLGEALLAWACHRPLVCCHDQAKCCRVPPLYLFTLDDCTCCIQYPLPCCFKQVGVVRGLLNRAAAGDGHLSGGHGCSAGVAP
jgi:hypothetical protein